MKKDTKIGIVMITLSVIISIVGVIISINVKKEKQLEEDMVTIKTTYTDFSIAIINNYDIKNDVISKLNSFDNESYDELHQDYIELLDKYSDNVKKINQEVDTLEKKCSNTYEDKSTTMMCGNYQELYETTNNDYVKYLTNYNEKLTIHNKDNDTKYDLYKLVNKEYIDFDNDGKYTSANVSK